MWAIVTETKPFSHCQPSQKYGFHHVTLFCFLGKFSFTANDEKAHIFPDELGDGAGQHEAGHSAAQDVEDGVHDARAGGRAHWRTEGTAERAGGGPTAATYLWGRDQEKTGSQGRYLSALCWTPVEKEKNANKVLIQFLIPSLIVRVLVPRGI